MTARVEPTKKDSKEEKSVHKKRKKLMSRDNSKQIMKDI